MGKGWMGKIRLLEAGQASITRVMKALINYKVMSLC